MAIEHTKTRIEDAEESFVMTSCQHKAHDNFKAFIKDTASRVFILKGYAGTGKTTMMKQFVKLLSEGKCHFSLLASTGRAAKILANATGLKTLTVHGEIYKFRDLNQDLEMVTKQREETKVDSTGQLMLNFELTPKVYLEENPPTHYYIVDEASMLSDEIDRNAVQAQFGSGRLLKDLMDYDTMGKFIFVGDVCQLPPITQSISPALSKGYMENTFGIKVYESELTEIVRQSKGNDIALSAQKMRHLYYNPQQMKWAKFPFRGYKNIHILSSQMELMHHYISNVKKNGFNSATMLTQQNAQCLKTTELLRPSFGIMSQVVSKGDLLLVTQNNFVSGLMNGDLVVLEDVIIMEKRAGLTFLKVTVRELFTGKNYSQLMIADIVYGNQTNLTAPQQKELYIDFYYRMKAKGIKQKTKQFKDAMCTDPYLNALRAVFGYVLTCHKAQGGEWDTVYLDIPRSLPIQQKPYIYQWVYTAMTRARKELYIVDDFWVM